VKTVSQHRAETRHKQGAPGHYTLASCMWLRSNACAPDVVVIVVRVILIHPIMLVCYYRGRVAVLTMPVCSTEYCHVRLLHVCSSLSSASVMAVPRNHLNLNLVFRRFPHLFLPSVQPVKLPCSPRLHGLLRLSVQHLRHDQPPDEKRRYRLCERLGRSLGKRWTVYCR
jgi:hypothetical protein